MAVLLKGAPVAKAITAELIERAGKLESLGVVPTLAIVRVGEREDDLSYERGALKRCEKVGISCRRYLLPADVSQEDLMGTVTEINEDPSIHGCLIFRPLPEHLEGDAVASALLPKKDVDSMTPASLLSTLSVRPLLFSKLLEVRTLNRIWRVAGLFDRSNPGVLLLEKRGYSVNFI